jgi:hypothetical protein
MSFDNFWDDLDVDFGPFRFSLGHLSKRIRYRRNDESHILQVSIDPSIDKGRIKARLVKPGLIEIEWPRLNLGEEIPID